MSIQGGEPVFKFLFRIGSDEYRYTSASYHIADSDGTYESAPIRNSSVKVTGELAKNGISIDLPRDNALAQRFLGGVPEVITTLTIFRDDIGLGSEGVFWKGRVVSAPISDDVVTLECEDVFTTMERPGLRIPVQAGCPYHLYSDNNCKVVKANFATDAEIVAVSGLTLTITLAPDSTIDSTSPPETDGYFSGGIVELADGTMRRISHHAGNVYTLLSAFNGLDVDSVGLACTLYPGCNRTISDCQTKFGNLDNYGGFPFFARKDLFNSSFTGGVL